MSNKLALTLAIISACFSLILAAMIFAPKSVKNVGAYITDPTVLTDLHITNDLVVDGAQTVTGAATLGRMQQGGSVGSLTNVTSTLSAANICSNMILKETPPTSTPTLTLPSTTTLFGTCLTSVGQSLDVYFTSVGTSSILAAGSGGTILYSSTLTIAADKWAVLRFVRDATATYKVLLVNLPN